MALVKKNEALVVALALLLLASEQASAITCGQVASSLSPCIPYATGSSATLTPGCCSGMRALNSAARTSADRQQTCRCLKTLATALKKVKMGLVAGAPAKCGVHVPFAISMSTDCNKVN